MAFCFGNSQDYEPAGRAEASDQLRWLSGPALASRTPIITLPLRLGLAYGLPYPRDTAGISDATFTPRTWLSLPQQQAYFARSLDRGLETALQVLCVAVCSTSHSVQGCALPVAYEDMQFALCRGCSSLYPSASSLNWFRDEVVQGVCALDIAWPRLANAAMTGNAALQFI